MTADAGVPLPAAGMGGVATGSGADIETCYELRAHGAPTPGDKSKYAVPTGETYTGFIFKAPWTKPVQGLRFRHLADNATVLHHWLLYSEFPGTLAELFQRSSDVAAALRGAGERLEATGRRVPESELLFLPPLAAPGKILCVGLNYAEHASEAGFKPPSYPTVFARFASSLVGPRASADPSALLERARLRRRTGGRDRQRRAAHPGGASARARGGVLGVQRRLRDYQLRTPQWTMGKNFDATGAFGPYLTLASALPAGRGACASKRA